MLNFILSTCSKTLVFVKSELLKEKCLKSKTILQLKLNKDSFTASIHIFLCFCVALSIIQFAKAVFILLFITMQQFFIIVF